MQYFQNLQLMRSVANRLEESTDARDIALVSQLLSNLHGSAPSFERAFKGFHEALEVSQEDLDTVRVMLDIRISLDSILALIDDEHLDDHMRMVDETLQPYEDAILCLEGFDELDRQYDEEFVNPNAWWGIFNRQSLKEAQVLVECWIEKEWERHAIMSLTTETVPSAKAARCLQIAETHLHLLYIKMRGQSWKEEGARRFDNLVMWDHEDWKADFALWDNWGHPLKPQLLKVAAKLVRSPDAKLDLFEKYLG